MSRHAVMLCHVMFLPPPGPGAVLGARLGVAAGGRGGGCRGGGEVRLGAVARPRGGGGGGHLHLHLQ